MLVYVFFKEIFDIPSRVYFKTKQIHTTKQIMFNYKLKRSTIDCQYFYQRFLVD